jgi:hypothetical protein
MDAKTIGGTGRRPSAKAVTIWKAIRESQVITISAMRIFRPEYDAHRAAPEKILLTIFGDKPYRQPVRQLGA